MKLINADALIANKFKNAISYNAFVNLVKRQPSIDLIHCRDCRNCLKYERLASGRYWCGMHDCIIDLDDFCSQGERKEDGKTN